MLRLRGGLVFVMLIESNMKFMKLKILLRGIRNDKALFRALVKSP